MCWKVLQKMQGMVKKLQCICCQNCFSAVYAEITFLNKWDPFPFALTSFETCHPNIK